MFTFKFRSALFFALAVPVLAGPGAAEELRFEGQTWNTGSFEDSAARVESYLGRDALFLRRNVATLEGAEYGDMVVEYEYATAQPSGFIGVNFRAEGGTGNLEQFYMRPHQSGEPDATQYMVMTNGSATWQLHAGPNEAVATDIPVGEWIRVRIVAIGDRADIFVGDMSTPLIHVPDLRSTSTSGGFTLYASDRPWMRETGAYFSNVSIRAATEDDKIIGEAAETDPLPEGLIDTFEVSAPFAEDKISDVFDLSELEAETEEWTALSVENDGVANIARTTPLADGKNTALVRFTLDAETEQTRILKFGYSDRVRVYVEGQLVYAGNAQWRARDHRFLGTIALVDSIAVQVGPGGTEVVAAVSESFGGWGFKAALSEE